MSHSDQVIDIMNAEPQPFQVFAAQLGEQLTRENIFQAREQKLLVCWKNKHFIHLSGAINAIFDLGKVLTDVQIFLSNEQKLRIFVAGEYTEALTKTYPPDKWKHIGISSTAENLWQYNIAIPHATFASGIVMNWY